MAVELVHDCDIERRSVPAATGGDFRDTSLRENNPDTVWDGFDILAGVVTSASEKDATAQKEAHGIVRIDLPKFIPASATPIAAEWWFYVYTTGADPDHVYFANRLATLDWIENEATWNEAKSGTNWPTAGGDFTTPEIEWGVLTTIGWYNKDLTALVIDAWTNRGKILNFLIRRYDAEQTDAGAVIAYDKERYGGAETAKVHHLRITYTLNGRTFQAFVH